MSRRLDYGRAANRRRNAAAGAKVQLGRLAGMDEATGRAGRSGVELLRSGTVRLGCTGNSKPSGCATWWWCPQSWEELSTGVKTDKSDARALCVRLGLYAAGNRRIFSVVHIPTAEQERARAERRLREHLRRTRQRIEVRGRSLLLTQGYRVTGRWWQSANWLQLSRSLPGWLAELLDALRECIVKAHQKQTPDPDRGRGRQGISQPVADPALSSDGH